MFFSTRGRYALRIMVELASYEGAYYVPLKVIADRQEISEKYMESIIASLVRAQLVTGVRGKGGGYRLAVEPEKCSAGDILRAAEGSLAPISCLSTKPNTCPRAENCKTLPLWEKMDSLITEFLDSVTLAQLIEDDGGDGRCLG